MKKKPDGLPFFKQKPLSTALQRGLPDSNNLMVSVGMQAQKAITNNDTEVLKKHEKHRIRKEKEIANREYNEKIASLITSRDIALHMRSHYEAGGCDVEGNTKVYYFDLSDRNNLPDDIRLSTLIQSKIPETVAQIRTELVRWQFRISLLALESFSLLLLLESTPRNRISLTDIREHIRWSMYQVYQNEHAHNAKSRNFVAHMHLVMKEYLSFTDRIGILREDAENLFRAWLDTMAENNFDL